MDRFTAVLGGDEGERPTVVLPFDPKERFGKARAPVRGRVNGTEFRTTVAVYSGIPLIGFNAKLRERAGIAIGDEVTVELELDDEPRTVEVPPPLRRALDEHAEAMAAFERLSYTHRREFAEWIAQAKREETRDRRVGKAIEMLETGVRHP
jgi:bifunctional DNA-binding transcriptional regulator/antitoxin component of YhaV-PrlF toxin-antitoxin module